MSYATVEFADNYFSGQYKSVWNTLDEETKQQLLTNASMNIDSLEYKGKKEDIDQSTEFPRVFFDCSGHKTYSDDNRVAMACCEEAIAIYKNDGENPNYSSFSGGGFRVGDIAVDNASSGNSGSTASSGYDSLISPKALQWLKPYLKSSSFKVIL